MEKHLRGNEKILFLFFLNWCSDITSKIHILLNIANLKPFNKFLQPFIHIDLWHSEMLERVPMTSFFIYFFFFYVIFEVSLENEHPLLIPVTYVPSYYRLQRQLCIPSVSEAIPKIANICTPLILSHQQLLRICMCQETSCILSLQQVMPS